MISRQIFHKTNKKKKPKTCLLQSPPPKLCPSAWKYLIKGKMYDLTDTGVLYITVESYLSVFYYLFKTRLRRVMGYIYPAGLGGFE